MKFAIITLTLLLTSMIFILEVSKAHATHIDVYSIQFEDHDGDTVEKLYYAAGADLSEVQLPEAPARVGYQFVGWSEVLPESMPHAHLIYEPVYVQLQVLKITI